MNEETKSSTKYIFVEPNPSFNEEKTDLVELTNILLKAWKTILSVTIACIAIACSYAIYAPEVYQSKIVVTGATEERNDPPFLLGEIEGLAAMAGISIPYNSNIDIIVKTISSRKFLQNFTAKYDIDVSNYKSDDGKNIDIVAIFQTSLKIDVDVKSDALEISLSWSDKNNVHTILNNLVLFTNEHFRQKAISNSNKKLNYLTDELTKTTLQDMRAVLFKLIASEKQKAMLANVNEDFALEVIDPAFPGYLVKPKRKMIVALGGFCGGCLGIFAVFFAHFLRNLKSSWPKVNS
jgi:uncharacterized protein involved in exopolysaccharide biosynthesis